MNLLFAVSIPDQRILHMSAYEDEPTSEAIADLKRELAEDPEFGMTKLIFDVDYELQAMRNPQSLAEFEEWLEQQVG